MYACFLDFSAEGIFRCFVGRNLSAVSEEELGIVRLFLKKRLGIGRLFLRKDRGLVGCFLEKAGDWSAVSKKGPGIAGLFLRKLVIGRLFLIKDRGLVG